MKLKITILLLISLGLFNCSSDDSGEEMSELEEVEEVEEVTLINYTDNVAAIISANCIECHGETPTNGAPISLHTFELMRDASDNVDFRMNSTANPMPPESREGLIAEADRAIITQWIADGLLEN